MGISDYMKICHDRGVKIYPIYSNIYSSNCFLIQVNNNGKITTYEKKLRLSKEINDALQKTYVFIAKKLLQKKQ
jgi:hypothetical protein